MTDLTTQYNLTFDNRSEYLYAHLKADKISVAIIRDYVTKIVAKSAETGKDRILLHRDIPIVLTEADVFYTVRESLDVFRSNKLALVNPYADIQKEVEFGMTVGQNRGANYRVFSNDADAEAWLLKA